ncbi:hypothetical protein OIU79_007854 [Salix purpurea]|uniref:Uncharacterized protein n=1 Tax=Salix purpurea TaxID=77065 RepID=A0A9Q0YVJ1_SALPP|nr:hypothetical protein OIU79_007854 [Salix purpurea]
MSLRQRSIPDQVTTTQSSSPATSNDNNEQPETQKQPPRPPTLTQRAISQTLTSTANLANLLPTGTLLAFQLLTPLFTNNGACDSATRPMTLILLALLALSCFLASFTDSVRSTKDGRVYYGLATFKRMYLFDCPDPAASGLVDLSRFRMRFVDVVHAVLSVVVFISVALRDKNVSSCLYPVPEHETQEVLAILPVGAGLICSLLFMVFPTTRHGIGYPVGLEKGLEMLNIFKSYSAKTSILDDFNFYENREESCKTKKSNKPATLRMDIFENTDFPKHTAAEEQISEDDSRTKKTTNPSTLINLTKNLSLNGHNQKITSVNKPIGNSASSVPAPWLNSTSKKFTMTTCWEPQNRVPKYSIATELKSWLH